MQTMILSATFFLISCICYAQSTVKALDREWSKATKGKLKKIEMGKRSNGWAVYYNKDDGSVFSVAFREKDSSKKVADSVVAYSFNFKNDILYRIYFSRANRLTQQNGYMVVYLAGNQIIAREMKGDIYLPPLDALKYKAELWLAKAREVVQSERRRL